MDTEDVEIDPSIAETMGFAGFGNARKRKFDLNDGFVDPKASGTGQQSRTEVNETNGRVSGDSLRESSTSQGLPTRHTTSDTPIVVQDAVRDTTADSNAPAMTTEDGKDPSNSKDFSLQALRDGVRNEHGDTVYFLPSFLEDPWKDLRPQ